MELKIEVKYIRDPRVYRLFRINKVDYSLDFFRFLALEPGPASVMHHEFLRHQNIRDALIQAAGWGNNPSYVMGTFRADFDCFMIDGYKVTNLNFLKFI